MYEFVRSFVFVRLRVRCKWFEKVRTFWTSFASGLGGDVLKSFGLLDVAGLRVGGDAVEAIQWRITTLPRTEMKVIDIDAPWPLPGDAEPHFSRPQATPTQILADPDEAEPHLSRPQVTQAAS